MSDPARLMDGARRYRPTGVVRATRLGAARAWRTARGSELAAAADDWLVSDGREEWTVAADTFARTYRALPDGRYAKHAAVDAVRADRPLEVPTPEGTAHAAPGDWVLRGIDGELWTTTDAHFRRHYEPEG